MTTQDPSKPNLPQPSPVQREEPRPFRGVLLGIFESINVPQPEPVRRNRPPSPKDSPPRPPRGRP